MPSVPDECDHLPERIGGEKKKERKESSGSTPVSARPEVF